MNLGFKPRIKSPTLAKWFSIVPGLGHIYAGAYTSGIIWLLLSLILLSTVFFGYIDLLTPFSGRTIVVAYYLFMVVWCWNRAGQIATQKNQLIANQDYFDRQKIVEE
ncbi:MAG: hypothetical protein N3A72_01485 [bacterium]|nr:hypothetical protein [bacterium]